MSHLKCPLVRRVREIRMHGLNGGPFHRFALARTTKRAYQ